MARATSWPLGRPQPPAALQVAQRPGERRVGRDGRRQLPSGLTERGVDAGRRAACAGVAGVGGSSSSPNGRDVEVDEAAPVDRPVVGKLPEAGQRWVSDASRTGRSAAASIVVVQPVAGPDHRVAEPVGRHRELHRHERLVCGSGRTGRLRPVVVLAARPARCVEHRRADDPRQEVVAARRTGSGSAPAAGPRRTTVRRVVVAPSVVEAQQQPLELRDDDVLVVARIADDRAARRRRAARQVAGVGRRRARRSAGRRG